MFEFEYISHGPFYGILKFECSNSNEAYFNSPADHKCKKTGIQIPVKHLWHLRNTGKIARKFSNIREISNFENFQDYNSSMIKKRDSAEYSNSNTFEKHALLKIRKCNFSNSRIDSSVFNWNENHSNLSSRSFEHNYTQNYAPDKFCAILITYPVP